MSEYKKALNLALTELEYFLEQTRFEVRDETLALCVKQYDNLTVAPEIAPIHREDFYTYCTRLFWEFIEEAGEDHPEDILHWPSIYQDGRSGGWLMLQGAVPDRLANVISYHRLNLKIATVLDCTFEWHSGTEEETKLEDLDYLTRIIKAARLWEECVYDNMKYVKGIYEGQYTHYLNNVDYMLDYNNCTLCIETSDAGGEKHATFTWPQHGRKFKDSTKECLTIFTTKVAALRFLSPELNKIVDLASSMES
jgi:hypothetical protein